MRTPPSDELTDVARRRLESLRQQLQHDIPQPSGREVAFERPPDHSAEALSPTGRHARPSLTRGARIAAWLAERLPTSLRGRAGLGMRELGVLAVLIGGGLAIAGWLALQSGSAEGDQVPASATPSKSTQQLVSPASPIADNGLFADEGVAGV